MSDIDNTTDCYAVGPPAMERQGQIAAETSMRTYLQQENPQALNMIDNRSYPYNRMPGPYASGFGPMGMGGMIGAGFGGFPGMFGGAGGQRGANGQRAEPMDGLMEAMMMMSMMGGNSGLGGGFGNLMKSPLGLGVLATMMS